MVSLASLETNFISWAHGQANVRAAIVVGSQARRNHPADQFSDLDIILFVTDVGQRQNEMDWIKGIGPLWLVQTGRTVAGDPEHLALFDGGLQVDFVYNPTSNLTALPQMIADGQVPDIVYRGVRVLLDKDHALPALPEPGPVPAVTPPTAGAFRQTLESFWFSAVYCTKQLCRGELLLFQNASGGMTWPLLRMIEWQARAAHGWDYDTWHAGKFIAEWADAPVYEAFQGCFGRYDTVDGWQAMGARLDLFHRLGRQVAEALGYDYPQHLENKIVECINAFSSYGRK